MTKRVLNPFCGKENLFWEKLENINPFRPGVVSKKEMSLTTCLPREKEE
jgi:hypothetical protein